MLPATGDVSVPHWVEQAVKHRVTFTFDCVVSMVRAVGVAKAGAATETNRKMPRNRFMEPLRRARSRLGSPRGWHCTPRGISDTNFLWQLRHKSRRLRTLERSGAFGMEARYADDSQETHSNRL